MFGDGRTPLTLAMLTMLPPSSCVCITALAFCAHTSAAVRLSAMIPAVKRGEAVAVSAGGDPPALLTSTSSEPNRATRRRDHRVDLIGLAHVGRHEQPAVGQVVGLVTAADRDVRARVGEALRDPAPDAAATAGDEHDASVESRQVDRVAHRGRSVRSDAAAPPFHDRARHSEHEEHECPFPTNA